MREFQKKFFTRLRTTKYKKSYPSISLKPNGGYDKYNNGKINQNRPTIVLVQRPFSDLKDRRTGLVLEG